MTKSGLFRLISVLIIFLSIVGVCLFEDRMVVSALNSVKVYCYEIEMAAEKAGGIVNGEVASLVDNLEYSWREDEEKLCYMTNHKAMEALGVEIVRLRTYIDEEEPIEFFTSIEIIKSYVESFQHFMGASFQNIL